MIIIETENLQLITQNSNLKDGPVEQKGLTGMYTASKKQNVYSALEEVPQTSGRRNSTPSTFNYLRYNRVQHIV